MPSNILEIKNLSVSFLQGNKIFHAVKGLSFDIEKSRSLGIIGESGSGKSVTALAIMGLLPIPPARVNAQMLQFIENPAGAIDLLSADNRQMRRIRGNRISMIFQEPMTSLNPVIKCGNQVIESIRAHAPVSYRDAKDKTLELFQEVRLSRPEEIFRSYPHELSGGQKQRIMIAMAVASRPVLLIADEPTTALDVSVQKSIIDLLKDLRAKYGMALLFITHDLDLAAEIADDILVMNQGQMIEAGTASEILHNPRKPYTLGLMACRPANNMHLKRLPTMADFTPDRQGNNVHKPISPLVRNEEEYDRHLHRIYTKPAIVRTLNLSTHFKSHQINKSKYTYIKAVDGVTLGIYPGEVFGLVGESGCGKTTLGRTILRLVDPSSGAVIYKDQDITRLRGREMRKLRKKMQFIFQDPYSSLNPRMTAGAAIMEPMKVHGIGASQNERRELTMKLLEKVGLEPTHFFRYPHELSGGQRQRICIARALAVQPEFIICDECVSALDVSVQAQVLNLLADLKDEFGLTYIFISHDLDVVRFISDRMAEMKEGKIISSSLIHSRHKIFNAATDL